MHKQWRLLNIESSRHLFITVYQAGITINTWY